MLGTVVVAVIVLLISSFGLSLFFWQHSSLKLELMQSKGTIKAALLMALKGKK